MKKLVACLALATATAAAAQKPPVEPGSDAELAQTLTNPVASLIQAPVQNNFDWGWGADGSGFRYQANIQPVVPISLNNDWNMISRTILPVIGQSDVTGPATSQFGLGDVVQSLFFSPAKPSASGLVWGAGPVLLVPTATDAALGTGKWGVGPTAVVLRLDGQFTYGALVNHIWSFAGKASRADVSATFVQPFLAYTSRTATTYSINTETTYDWTNDQWLVPINVGISQLVVVGKQPVSIGAGARYWVESPRGGPDWGMRLSLTMLFPK